MNSACLCVCVCVAVYAMHSNVFISRRSYRIWIVLSAVVIAFLWFSFLPLINTYTYLCDMICTTIQYMRILSACIILRLMQARAFWLYFWLSMVGLCVWRCRKDEITKICLSFTFMLIK